MVKNLTIATAACFLLILQWYHRPQRQLISEVYALERPDVSRPRQIDAIVHKYIAPGMTEDAVKAVLSSEGLRFSEGKIKDRFADCLDCNEPAIWAKYSFDSFFSLKPADRSLAIDIGFKEGKATIVRGWYLTHVD